MKVSNVQYNPRRFSAAILQIKNPKATALLFSNGKVVCLGTKNEVDSKLACIKVAKFVKAFCGSVRFTGYRIVNMIATYDFGFQIRL